MVPYDINGALETAMDGVAAGVLMRRMADGSLGDLEPDDAFDMATDVATNPEAVGCVLGVSPQEAEMFDPEVFRESIMAQYDISRSVDSLTGALMRSEDFRESMKAKRFSTVMAHADVADDQRARIEEDVANGDRSALNGAMESFFFE